MKTYTYQPDKIPEMGLDRMRFELGDTMVEGGSDVCALTDEEIRAALQVCPTHWKKAKLMLVESVCRRFSYEVDTKTEELSLSLSQRAKLWQNMYQDLKEEIEAEDLAVPIFADENQGHRPYFYTGMMQNFAGGGTEQG